MNRFESAFAYNLIYVFAIDDEAHNGCVKIGKATVKPTLSEMADVMRPNSNILNTAAKKRIDGYTKTAGIKYRLLHTEIALRDNGHNGLENFLDTDVHDVLKNSGVKQKKFENSGGIEWYETNLPTAINAIAAVKNHQLSLSSSQVVSNHDVIEFRPEQLEAIEKTVKRFKTGKKMLWNAKMRFGKTLSALEVVKRMKYRRTIIITHRPIVRDGWREDFGKIFGKGDGYYFTAKSAGTGISQLEDCLKRDVPLVHFASIQDLRGSSLVGGNFDKNDIIFKTEWDLVIIDEAHEGTLTSLGDEVKNAIIKDNAYGKTRVLELSGTPFNLLEDFEEDEIYTWDYVMEQTAKYNWDRNHFLDSNPYEGLPKLEIYTYNLGSLIKGFVEMEDNAFNFAEFFRTWTGIFKYDHCQMPENTKVGDFVHEGEVRSFLNLMCKSDDESNYPYSSKEYREYFRHTLWMVPGVKEARALSRMLRDHDVFGQFEIVNVAGDGDEEEPSSDALEKVKKAIGDDPDKTWTITLSCGKLTTGVSVKPWTAVMMLAGTYSTSASNYLQTIFRVQTPASINGRMKDRCYVFDFAPDRTLKMVAEAGKLGIRPGATQSRTNMGSFLNFCPVIAIDGSEMKPYNVDSMLQQLKRAYASKVVASGFDDTRLYNDELLKLDDMDIKEFENLQKIIGKDKANKIDRNIVINSQGLTDEEREQLEKIEKKKKKEPLSEEEKKRLEQLKKAKEERGKAIKILRAISIRIPMLIYGMGEDFDTDITIDKFVDNIDDTSWAEFMPQGVTKEVFNKFKKYYDRDIFIAAGKQIRAKLKGADSLDPTDRVMRIAEIFSSFKNPDKETVLTPWRVVNMHMSDTLGGYDFYDGSHQNLLEEPRFVSQGEVTESTVSNAGAKVLEINSKSGLYPLYLAYSIFRKRLGEYSEEEQTEDLLSALWNQTVQENTVRKMNVYPDSHEVFSNVEIKGGVCYFLIDSKNKGLCNYSLLENGESIVTERALDDFDILIRNPKLSDLVKKIVGQFDTDQKTVADIISSDTPFGIPTNPFGSKKTATGTKVKRTSPDDIEVYYIDDKIRSIAYINRKEITKNAQDIDKYKVFVPKAAGSGNDPYVLGKPEIADKGAVCSQTYMYVAFDTKDEALNFVAYLKTKFFRVLVSASKVSQDAPPRIYRFVPLQDFSKSWTDEELYQRYKLTQGEIDFIENQIKPL